ncbi:Ig-like domain-containing protein, partial [Patescibacteria group bacterium]
MQVYGTLALVGIVAITVLSWFMGISQPVFAATCNISANTTIDQSYVTTNTCGDVNITGDATLTFTEAINLAGAGAGTFTISSGVTATFDGDFELSDANDSLMINGTVTHANAAADGVDITTAGDTTISSSGVINVNEKGCQASVSGGDGYGPDTSNVCIQSNAGAGYGHAGGNYNSNNGAAGGAAHGGTGGDGDGWNSDQGSDTFYDSPTAPLLLGSSGGSANRYTQTAVGGAGGGLIIVRTGGDFTFDGTLSADGGDGGYASSNISLGGGGGSGGSIYLNITGEFNYSSAKGSFSVDGGDGGHHPSPSAWAGGGGGGRIGIVHAGGNFNDDSGDFTATGGNGEATAEDGAKGTVYVKDTNASTAVTIYHGFTYGDVDYNETSWTTDVSATNQYCGLSSVTPSVTADYITFGGALDCDGTVTDFTWKANVDFVISPAASMTYQDDGATIDFDIVDGDNQTWNNFTFTGPDRGYFTIDDRIAVALTNGTTITSNVNWSDLASLNMASGTTISANEKGCQISTSGANGYGPDGSNVCTISTAGAGNGSVGTKTGSYGGGGGAAHGGNGGDGSQGTGVKNAGSTTTYGDSSAPALFGSSGGTVESNSLVALAGVGGGLVRIKTAADMTIEGTISADAGDGGINPSHVAIAGGGGSGGSVYLQVGDEFNSTSCTITAAGGDGGNANNDGGGGGGGRVAVKYVTDSSSCLSSMAAATVVPGGAATDYGVAGSTGSFNEATYSAPNNPTVSAPAGGATGQDRNLALSTSAYSSDGAPHTSTGYQISDDNTFSNDCSDANLVWCILNSSNLTSVVVNYTNGSFQNALAGKAKLAPATTYYVRTRHANGVGVSAWSAPVAFTTAANNNPSAPTNSAPADAATSQSKNPTLQASAYSDPDSDSHSTSDWAAFEGVADCSGTADWRVTGSSNLTSVVVNSTNGTFADALAGRTTLRAHTTYSFHGRYTDEYSGTSSYSACTSFTTLNNSPVLDSSVPTQSLTEDVNSVGAFDLDTYFSDVDFNDDDDYNCTATNGFSAALGTMTINANRTVDFTLAANANGSDTVAYSCTDNGGAATASNTFTVTVAAVNDTPVANAGSDQSVNEADGTVTLDGTGSSDIDGDTVTYSWQETADTTNSCSLSSATLSRPTVTLVDRVSSYSCTFK